MMIAMSSITVTGLHLYPIKGTHGIAVPLARVGDRGFVDDRRFVITDLNGKFLTQRTLPRLALVTTELDGATLRLRAPGMPSLELARTPKTGAPRVVEVWDDRCDGLAVEGEAAAWLSQFLATPCELVYMPDDSRRPVDPDYAPGAQVSFADGFPFLLASESSLAELARRGAEVPMSRFRPNLVIAGAAPFAEDTWRAVRIGEVRFAVVKPCARCPVTTVDQETAVMPSSEPLRTLATFRRREGGVMFGQNLVHEGPGVVRVGDAVIVE